jgi:hypothetical protein
MGLFLGEGCHAGGQICSWPHDDPEEVKEIATFDLKMAYP